MDFNEMKENLEQQTKDFVISAYLSLRDDYEYVLSQQEKQLATIERHKRELFHIRKLNTRLIRENNGYKGIPKVPVLFVKDNTSGKIHAVGSKKGDTLHISKDKQFVYYENEEYDIGTKRLERDNPNSQPYEFVNFDPATNVIEKSDRCDIVAQVNLDEKK